MTVAKLKRVLGFVVPIAIMTFAILLLKFPTLFDLSAEKVTLVLLTLIGLEFLLERLTYLEKIPAMHEAVSRLDSSQKCFGHRGSFGSTEEMIRNAKDKILISGITLTVVSQLRNLLEEKASKGVNIRLIAIHPDVKFVGGVADYFGEKPDNLKRTLDTSLAILLEMQAKYPDHIQLHTIRFRPAFGYAACDPESAHGFIRVESYTCKSFQSERPMMQFTRVNALKEFESYYHDLERVWGMSKEYNANT